MPQKKIICRYCEQEFILVPGKPGYANECPKCLIEKLLKSKSSVTSMPRKMPRKIKSLSVQEKIDRENAEFNKAMASFIPQLRKWIDDASTPDSLKAEYRLLIRLALADKAKEKESIRKELSDLKIKTSEA